MKLPKIAVLVLALVIPCSSTSAVAVEAVDWAGTALRVPGSKAGRTTEIATEDVLNLRDFGGLTVSPDGRNVAFSVRQGDADSNRYYMRIFVAPIDGSHLPVDLGIDGGQPIPASLYGLPYAYIPAEYARWSRDGRYLAVRRMDGHRIELWVIEIATKRSTRVADGVAQVDSFAWADNGALIFHTGLDFQKFERELNAEAKHGFLWDERIPHYASYMYPGIPECIATPRATACQNQTFAYWPGTAVRSASTDEAAVLTRIATANHHSRDDGAEARAEIVDPRYRDAITPIRRLTTNAPGARPCTAEACIGSRLRTYGWTREGDAIWFLRLESNHSGDDGAPGEVAALYAWDPDSGKVRLLHKVQGWIDDCQIAERALVCIEETPVRPRRVISVDFRGGGARTIANANPVFDQKDFPKVRGIYLKDRYGGIYYAQVVYPVGYTRGRKYPLVVVQYGERGFLRGQVGGEYPIYPMANAGFVVLSVNWNRPPSKLSTETIEDLNREYSKNGREVVREVIDSGVDQLVAEGLADPKKMAITGLSAGAEMVNYILQRSNRYAAAISSSAAQDITFFALVPEGPARSRLMWEFDTDTVIPPPGNSIYDMSWATKPDRLRTPLLVNVGEHEALTGFEGYEAIKHAGGPLEVRIFPDEQHIKYHPQSYAGVFENNMQWLRFWLLGEEDTRPEFADQYARWRKMAEKLTTTKP